jgi:hypothetical protein
LVLNLAGAAPFASRTAARGVAATRSSGVKVAAGLWAPPKKTKPKASKEEGESQEEELLKPRKPAGDAGTKPAKHRPIKMDESADDGDDDAEDGDDEDGDEDKAKVVKKRKRVVEEEEEADEPIASQLSVIPRLVTFDLGPTMMRRGFAYNLATEQGDHGFRFGYQFALESFPMVTQPGGWYRTLGIGAYYEKEYGDATRTMPSGLFSGAAVNHSRWGFDVRYAIPAGEWVIVMPALGYGRLGTDLQRTPPTMPSMCTSATPDPCFGDITAAYLSADLHLRVGVSPRMALSLSGGYLLGLGVSRGADQITAEASASMNGFHVELGASMLIGDYFAVSALVPVRRYSFAFDTAAGSAFTAKSATDMYYGLIAGFTVMTR